MTSSKPKIVSCVLRSGGVYTADYVNRLANAVARNLTIPYRFVCLTDLSEGFGDNVHELIPLRHGYPGWWSKVELFRFDLYPDHQWFFLDLDTVIIGNVDDIIGADSEFTTLDDFYRPGSVGSGLMAWRQGGYNHIYDGFVDNDQHYMRRLHFEGDQTFIEESVGVRDTFQHRFPGRIVSFKKHCVRSATDITVPSGAGIICFHGTPKPHEAVRLITIKENWK